MKFWMRVIPQVLLVFLLSTHLLIGAQIFQYIDPVLEEIPFFEVVFFEFVMISTIGYGNIAPTTDASKLFSILFSIIGIPLLLVTLANFGKYLTKFYWKFQAFVKSRSAESKLSSDSPMPVFMIISLFFFTFLTGTIVIPHNGRPYSIDDVYFSFISFSTVGFGDKIPMIPTFSKFVLVLFYLVWGVMLTTILFNVTNTMIHRVYYFGRRFKGARDVEVWMGGQCITVSEITALVAEQFHASPHEVREILQELDELMENAVRDSVENNNAECQEISV